jgi:hypothetical protein
MKKNIFMIGCVLYIALVALSGCQEQGSTTDESFEGIYLESSVVELAYATLEFHTIYDFEYEKDIVEKVEVKYLFHNIADRDVNITVTVEFYDKDKNLLGSEAQQKTSNLFKDYTESMVNIVSYNGERITEVDHVKIIAIEC